MGYSLGPKTALQEMNWASWYIYCNAIRQKAHQGQVKTKVNKVCIVELNTYKNQELMDIATNNWDWKVREWNYDWYNMAAINTLPQSI